MSSQIYSLIHLFRRLTSAVNDALDSVASPDDDKEPGQQIGDGDIALSCVSLDNSQHRSRTNLYVIAGELFRRQLDDTDTVLLDIYNSNGLYMCQRSDLEAKICAHVTQTDAYSFIEELNDANPTCIRQQLDNVVEKVTTLLQDLLARQCITDSQFYQMTVESSMVRMDYCCFLPDTSKEGLPFRPFMVCCLSPLMGIARLVSRLLRPVYDEFVMANQMFLFRKRVYRQSKGGTVNSPLTLLLADIYMFYRQADLVKLLVDKDEVFGRCFDEAFLTWNGSNSSLRSLLNTTIQKQNPSLPITIAIGQKVNYLNVQIYHMHGKLKTKISHDMDIEPRALPYIVGHPPDTYSTLVRASLMRAVLCCSTLSDFREEHRDIKNIFFSNGFSRDYTKEKTDCFFEEFNALALQSRYTHQNAYTNIRRRIFEHDREQTEMKIKHRTEEQHQDIWYIPAALKGDDLNTLKEDFQRLWEKYRLQEPQLANVNIEIVGHPKYPDYTK